MEGIISESTGISIGLVFTAAGLIAAAVVWMAKIHMAFVSCRKESVDLRKRIDRLEAENNDLLQRVVRIETKIDFLIAAIKPQS